MIFFYKISCSFYTRGNTGAKKRKQCAEWCVDVNHLVCISGPDSDWWHSFRRTQRRPAPCANETNRRRRWVNTRIKSNLFVSEQIGFSITLTAYCFFYAVEFYASVVESIMRGDNVGITARRSRSATAAASMAMQSPVSSCIAYFRLPRAPIHKNYLSLSLSMWAAFVFADTLPHFDFGQHSTKRLLPLSCVFATFLRRGDLGLRIATCFGCVMGSRMRWQIISAYENWTITRQPEMLRILNMLNICHCCASRAFFLPGSRNRKITFMLAVKNSSWRILVFIQGCLFREMIS